VADQFVTALSSRMKISSATILASASTFGTRIRVTGGRDAIETLGWGYAFLPLRGGPFGPYDGAKHTHQAFGKGDIKTIIDHLADQLIWDLVLPPSFPYAGVDNTPDQLQRDRAWKKQQRTRRDVLHGSSPQSNFPA
jgi:hypothetical protein